MAEAPLAVASAVILPEDSAETPVTSSSPILKRRQTSFSDDKSKRPRLSHGESNDRLGPAASLTTSATNSDRASERRKSGEVEERKRGKRLFGALLGTLSQSSSSTAQKRRTDIEKKQQDKLKQQAEEQDEKKKQKREALLAIRRREQVKYDKQSMQIRHSNMLAQAHFLHTRTEPKLYYKPWELLSSDEEKIKAQIDEAERTVERESTQWDEDHPVANQEPPPDIEAEKTHTEANEDGQDGTVGSATNGEKSSTPTLLENTEDTNMNGTTDPDGEQEQEHTELPEASKDHGDDGGEVLVGEEDTVIY